MSVTCGRSLVSPGSQVSSTSKTDCHKIAEILLKVVLNTIAPSDHDISKDIHIHRITAFWRSKQNMITYSLTRQAGILVSSNIIFFYSITSHWAIICSIRIRSLILTISLIHIKGKTSKLVQYLRIFLILFKRIIISF